MRGSRSGRRYGWARGITLLRPDVQPEPAPHDGLDPQRLRRLGKDGWLYQGDLTLDLPLRLQAKLVVRGSFRCAPGSYFEDDVKATGSLHIGECSIVRGNLVADEDLETRRALILPRDPAGGPQSADRAYRPWAGRLRTGGGLRRTHSACGGECRGAGQARGTGVCRGSSWAMISRKAAKPPKGFLGSA